MSQVKERPILFSGPMVQALLNGTKTQTRRDAKLNIVHREDTRGYVWCIMRDGEVWHSYQTLDELAYRHCPYGQPGDRLWVRETFARVPRTAYACSTGVEQTINPASDWEAAIYRAGWTRCKESWKPSIHMPRWASRILLEIVSVRVERLQDISFPDAVAEGIEVVDGRLDDSPVFKNYHPKAFNPVDGFGYPNNSYFSLWDSINGEDSHKANPWVWVVSFKRITPRPTILTSTRRPIPCLS